MAGLNIAGLVWLSCLLLTSPSAGAEARQSLKLVAHILPRASLRLSQDQITFAGYEDQAVIPSQEGPQVTVRGRTSPGSSLVLSLGAASGLEGPKASIPDSQVTCSFQGKGAVGRVALDWQQQPLARWRTGGVHTGELHCVLNNPKCIQPGDLCRDCGFDPDVAIKSPGKGSYGRPDSLHYPLRLPGSFCPADAGHRGATGSR